LRAIRREGLRRTLLVELARAAPDLFLEAALCQTIETERGLQWQSRRVYVVAGQR